MKAIFFFITENLHSKTAAKLQKSIKLQNLSIIMQHKKKIFAKKVVTL